MGYVEKFSYNVILKFNHTRTFNSCSAIRANTVYTYNLCTTISKLCTSFRCTIPHSHALILTHFLSSLTFFTMLVRVHFDSSRLVLSRLASLWLALLSSLFLFLSLWLALGVALSCFCSRFIFRFLSMLCLINMTLEYLLVVLIMLRNFFFRRHNLIW